MATTNQKMAKSPNRFQDRTGKWAFGVFAALGLAIIVAIEATNSPKVFSMSVCAALMLLYAALTYAMPALRARADQIGDNVYYLGLLYTLISLAAAIVRLADDPDAADAILRNFGVALITTILGITLRVIISQMRDDPVDVERETRATLLESTRAFREELEQSATELRQFHFSLRQRVDEAVNESLGRLADGFRQIEEVDRVIASLVTSLRRSADAAGALDGTVDRLSRGFSGFGLVEDQLVQLSRSLSQANESAQGLQSQFLSIGSTLGSTLSQSIRESLDSNTRSAAETSKALVSLRESARDLESLSRALAKVGKTFSDELGDSHQAVAKVRDEMADLADYILKRLET